MAVKINFNEASAQTHTSLVRNERAMTKSLLRLSTGARILNAADDSAGLFIADMLSTVAKAYEQGNRNIQTGISALQIAEAASGQIFDKLQEIYVRAQNAANDINDPNARAALQKEIRSFVEAIQKIGTDTEYNGIKLLDGTFTGRYIHYGSRADQLVSVAISPLKATDLGAFLVSGTGRTTSSSNSAYAASVTGNWRFGDASDRILVNGISLAANVPYGAVDAYSIAKAINENADLQAAGISARAKNLVTGGAWTGASVNISNTASATVVLRITEGSNTDMNDTAKVISFTASATSNTTLFSNLDTLVNDINTQAANKGLSIRAKNVSGRLALETNGKTIGVQVETRAAASGGVGSGTSATVSFDLAQIFGGSSVVVSSTGDGASDSDTGSGIKVGDLTIAGIDRYSYDFTGISATNEGLGLSATGDATARDLYSIDVRTNESAEIAIDIVSKALQKADTVRSQIGATMNNLQSIFDSQKIAYDNTKEAESVIRNTDYAKEMSEFTTYQIRMQATVAMLAQGNTLPQLVLQLLR
jgi:flagellin